VAEPANEAALRRSFAHPVAEPAEEVLLRRSFAHRVAEAPAEGGASAALPLQLFCILA
jgi:hypothetical protein